MTTAPNGPLLRLDRFTWFLLVIVGSILAVVLFSIRGGQDTLPSIYTYQTGDSPEVVLHNAYIAYHLGDKATLEALYMPDAWQEFGEDMQNDYRFGSVGGYAQVYGMRVGQARITTDQAQVQITRYISSPRGFLGMRSIKAVTFEATLGRVDGEWKVADSLHLLPDVW